MNKSWLKEVQVGETLNLCFRDDSREVEVIAVRPELASHPITIRTGLAEMTFTLRKDGHWKVKGRNWGYHLEK